MASKMATFVLLGLCLVFTADSQSTTFTDPLKIVKYPDLLVHALDGGDLNLLSLNGDIKIGINRTGRILFDGEDLNYIIELITSRPPVWEDNSPFGYLGEFHAGQRMDVTVKATDPEKQHIVYSVVSGRLPPGLTLTYTGRIHGLIPDSDATYTFTIRASDVHGHFADSVFKIVTRGVIDCESKPCTHQGVCQDLLEGYKCFCGIPYGGLRCEIDCRNNHLIGPSNAKVIPDGSMTGHNMFSYFLAPGARMNDGGWWGMGSTSYLQVDLGKLSQIENFEVRGRNGEQHYYTGSYYIQYSIDGNTFYNYTVGSAGNAHSFAGSATGSVSKVDLPEPLDTRFIRFYPLSWNGSYRPYINVEINGCHR